MKFETCTKCNKIQFGGWNKRNRSAIKNILNLRVPMSHLNTIFIRILNQIHCLQNYTVNHNDIILEHGGVVLTATNNDVNHNHLVLITQNLNYQLPNEIDRCQIQGRQIESRIGLVRYPTYLVIIYDDPRKEEAMKYLHTEKNMMSKDAANLVTEYL